MKPTRCDYRCLSAIVLAVAGYCTPVVSDAAEETAVTSPKSTPAIAVVKYDVAPSAKRKVAPVYPYDLLIQGKTGWAEATFVIDYVGRPLFANPKNASDPAFAKALVAMVEASEYVPGKRDKRIVMSPTEEKIQFSPEQSLDDEARRVLSLLRAGGAEIPSLAQLDERPRAVRQDSPAYPRALKDDGLTGQAEIEFVIDRQGRALFPRIVSATHEDFGWAAATAVARWRFQPPTRNGEKVEARMSVPILFDSRKLAASD
ncbi:hypothetical protein DB347_21430 [Opitutaceae bacterium EW11]|nr:hypothetical protein DB347_21430 [Opitutaceae bacterium EW11]